MPKTNYQICYIEEDKTRTQYAVRGRDPISGRIWLATTENEYDGYDGDLILTPAQDMVCGDVLNSYIVVLADDRTSLPRKVKLVFGCH